MKIQRNESCPCKSGKKYKKCCLPKVQDEAYTHYNQNQNNNHFVIAFKPEVEDECNLTLNQLEKDGNITNAKTVANRLYNLYPDNHMVNFLQGACFIKEEKLTDAIPYFEKAIHM